MNLEDARTIAELAVTVDGGCVVCAGTLLGQLQLAFPYFDWAELAPPARNGLYDENEWRQRIADYRADLALDEELA